MLEFATHVLGHTEVRVPPAVVLDVGRGTFAPGQAYVALSRCRSLEGLVLHTPLKSEHVLIDPRAQAFLARAGGAHAAQPSAMPVQGQ